MVSRTTTERSVADDDDKVIATIPHVKGTSERIARTLRPHNITVAQKPSTTVRNILRMVKDPSSTNFITSRSSLQHTVHRIPCQLSEKLEKHWNVELKNRSATRQIKTR